jgi:hypothetical protein
LMNTKLFIISLLGFLLLMTACSPSPAAASPVAATPAVSNNGSDTNAAANNSGPANGTPQAGFGQNPLTGEELYLVGIFKLEGTDQAITSAQATTLLPLWQSLTSQGTTPTPAADQISSITDQIKAVLTSQQIDAITALNLTQNDMITLSRDKGLTPTRQNASGTPFAPGNGSGGGQGNNNQGQTPNQTPNPQQQATRQAGRGQFGGQNNRMIQPLINALIDLLKTRAQA